MFSPPPGPALSGQGSRDHYRYSPAGHTVRAWRLSGGRRVETRPWSQWERRSSRRSEGLPAAPVGTCFHLNSHLKLCTNCSWAPHLQEETQPQTCSCSPALWLCRCWRRCRRRRFRWWWDDSLADPPGGPSSVGCSRLLQPAWRWHLRCCHGGRLQQLLPVQGEDGSAGAQRPAGLVPPAGRTAEQHLHYLFVLETVQNEQQQSTTVTLTFNNCYWLGMLVSYRMCVCGNMYFNVYLALTLHLVFSKKENQNSLVIPHRTHLPDSINQSISFQTKSQPEERSSRCDSSLEDSPGGRNLEQIQSPGGTLCSDLQVGIKERERNRQRDKYDYIK